MAEKKSETQNRNKGNKYKQKQTWQTLIQIYQ